MQPSFFVPRPGEQPPTVIFRRPPSAASRTTQSNPLKLDHIRNFCIVAHIDHGKSTLADRLIEATGMLQKREMKAQVLDTLDLERERGITIKLNAVRMTYVARNGESFELNLIDTPGHVDFTYEVSRSLNACEGAILVVDASQGIQAQTLSNLFLAMDAGLEIIPVLNKIDLPGAEPEQRAKEIMELIGASREEILAVSAKEGTGVPELLEAIVARVPPPRGREDAPLRALIFDSYYDRYRGAVPSIRVVDGVVREGMEIAFGSHPDDLYHVDEVGYLRLGQHPAAELRAGEVGYLVASLRDVRDARVGDTIFDASNRASELLPGYREVKSMVFAGVYPTDSDQYENLRDALEKLRLNDASLHYEPESSTALCFGFRCGFLGLLHMEIVQERLEREFDMDLVTTAPGVLYRVTTTDGVVEEIDSPAKLPDAGRIQQNEEPVITALIMTPAEHVGGILQLCQDKRGVQKKLEYLSADRVLITYELPFNEVVLDFYDKLKTISRGYASLVYHVTGYWPSPLVKLDILVNGDPVDALSIIVHKDMAYDRGRLLASKMRELIPRQMFEIAIQAAIGGRIIARESVKALRKNVLAKCYGGDISRKRKLLEKQKEGKKRLNGAGPVKIPQGRSW